MKALVALGSKTDGGPWPRTTASEDLKFEDLKFVKRGAGTTSWTKVAETMDLLPEQGVYGR